MIPTEREIHKSFKASISNLDTAVNEDSAE